MTETCPTCRGTMQSMQTKAPSGFYGPQTIKRCMTCGREVQNDFVTKPGKVRRPSTPKVER